MPNGGFISAYLFADFSFENDNNQLVPSQNGPFSLPSNAQATLASGAEKVELCVIDDDPEFEDGFQDDTDPIDQNLFKDEIAIDAAGNTITLEGGDVLEVEFTLRATPVGGGSSIDLLFVAVGPGETQRDLQLVVATALLTPGQTYDITFLNDGGGTPYADIPCFVRGTHITTPEGERRVEELRVGDMVLTASGKARKITWLGHRAMLLPSEANKPVRISAGALGFGLPKRDLWVSPQHGMMLSDYQFDMYFQSMEVLVRAGHLTNRPGIDRCDVPVVEYFHIMLEDHDIILAEGTATETFLPGPDSRAGLESTAVAALCVLHPELANPRAPSPFKPARPYLRAYEARLAQVLMAQRGLKLVA